MSVMPGPFLDNLPPLTPAATAEAVAMAKRKRNVAVTAEVSGLVILSLGLAMWTLWVGVVAFGLGVILIGIGLELS